MCSSERLEWTSALDQDTEARGPRDACNEGHRCCKDQRARRCSHQHSESTGWVAGKEPRRSGKQKRNGQQEKCVAIGKSNEWCFRRLRGGHHAYDTRIGAFACNRCGSQFEGLTGVDRTAVDRVAFVTGNRNRLSRQRRLVEGGAGTRYDAVNGDDLARARTGSRPRSRPH